MIEFKAECGHTIRARDEDAGDVARCSYCGRRVPIPINQDGDLSFLFRDVVPNTGDGERKKSWWRRKKTKPRKRRNWNPISIVFRVFYIVALVVVAVIVAQKVILPMFDAQSRKERFAGKSPTARTVQQPESQPQDVAVRYGFLPGRWEKGLMVSSVPGGASVFYVPQADAPVSGRINGVVSSRRFRANEAPVQVPDGMYVVEVVFAWNDASLTDSSLAFADRYIAFRRGIETASQQTRRSRANEFFLPDEAADVFVDKDSDQLYIVRQYRDVRIDKGLSEGVHALFLPRVARVATKSFLLEPLLHGYVASEKQYGFDEAHLRGELTFFGVVSSDQSSVIEMLARIGAVPYSSEDGRVRFFKVSPTDGSITARVIREVMP